MRRIAIPSVSLAGALFAGACFYAGKACAADQASAQDIPRAVTVARATAIPSCTVFVDAAAAVGGDGTAQKPHKSIAAAVEAAKPGAIVCVAEGTYAEQLAPGEKYFTLVGGFQSGKDFKARDSAAYVSKAVGKAGSFIRIVDPGPTKGQLTAIDGFEISGYSQAIVRDHWESQSFEVTNNFIHDNKCADQSLAGAGVALVNVSGTIKGNVFQNNSCGRGGAVFLNDSTNENTVSIEDNRIDGNAGTEPGASHGGAVYVFGNTLKITGNEFTNNRVTQWGGGLYVGAYTEGNQPTTATLAWNVYRGNRAGNSGGGFFCDDGAACFASHEVYDRNCGGNILVDGGSSGSGPTTTRFDRITNVGALTPACDGPGIGALIDNYEVVAPDNHTFTNAIFWGNAPGGDFATACSARCGEMKVSVTYSMVQTNYADGSVKIDFGAGNVAPADPLFVDLDSGDFRLKPGSPAIGEGSPGTDLGAFGGSGGAPAAGGKVTAKSEAAPPPPAPPPPALPQEAAKPEPAPQAPEDAPRETAKKESTGGMNNVSAKQAFDDAKELGTVGAWNAFLANYPEGFYADLARAYLAKLQGVEAVPPAPVNPEAEAPAPEEPAKPETAPAPAAEAGEGAGKRPAPAVARGGDFMGFPEKFNRYYTDPAWKPSKTLYVSPEGGGDGAKRETPMSVKDAFAAAQPGIEIYFLRGNYQGCFELAKEQSGTYDDPIVLYGERNEDGSIGASMKCCTSGRRTCFNFEGADYIAVDGFEFIGGKYGVRAIGQDYAASQHSRGIAVIDCVGHDQDKDPFFSGQADWAVWEGLVAYGAKEEDGHGIYLSNGGDWNIVRFNETYGNVSSDFQINADPANTCATVEIPFDDPRCDAYAGEGEGGQGASDYFLVDGNYFHHGLAQGPNFTSVRRSVVRNNVFGPQMRHNVSFWQETDNPKLGSSENKILHNLFITTGRHGVKFENHSTRNEFANNVILGVQVNGDTVTANPKALLMEVDETAGDNVYRSNLYLSGFLEGREPNSDETMREDFSAGWFTAFPAGLNHDPSAFIPTEDAPFLGLGQLSADAPADRNDTARADPVDLGPIELP